MRTSLPPITSGISMRSLAHLLEPALQALAFGAAGRVVVDRLVARRAADGRSRGCSCLVHYGRWTRRTSCGSAAGRAAANRRSPGRSHGDSICSSTTSTAGRGCTRRACRRPSSARSRWTNAGSRRRRQRMLEWFVTTSRHRFRLVLEDLRALPDSPLAIVEGPQLLPTSVAAVLRRPRSALPAARSRRAGSAAARARADARDVSDGERARANATERDLLITRRFGPRGGRTCG